MSISPNWLPPDLRGRMTADAPLKALTWFRTGGPADWLFEPADKEDLALFLAALPADMPLSVLGTGANVLVRDGGVEGVVVTLGRAFRESVIEGANITAGAGVSNTALASLAAEASLTGLEFLRTVPGTVGGAIAMNAGAYGQEIADTLTDIQVILKGGTMMEIAAADLALAYRQCRLPDDAVIVHARFACRPHDADSIAQQMQRVLEERQDAQPVNAKTGGSTFKNPPDYKAWELIDDAGCRGLALGGAYVSDKHCNFLIANEGASAADIEMLGEMVRQRVKEVSGIDLEWEIRRIGRRPSP